MNPEVDPLDRNSEMTVMVRRSLDQLVSGTRFNLDISSSPHITPKQILAFVGPYLQNQEFDGSIALEVNIIDPTNMYLGSKFPDALVGEIEKVFRSGLRGGISLTHAGETRLLREALIVDLPDDAEFIEAEMPLIAEEPAQPQLVNVAISDTAADVIPTDSATVTPNEPTPLSQGVVFLGQNKSGTLPYYWIRVDPSKGDPIEGLTNKYPLKDFALLVEFVGEKLPEKERVENLQKIGSFLIGQGGSAALEVNNGVSTVYASANPAATPVGKRFGVPALPSPH